MHKILLYSGEQCISFLDVDNIFSRRDYRGRGLGRELIRRSLQVASSSGCEACFVFATGKYSQRIFSAMDFKVNNSKSDFKNATKATATKPIPGPPRSGLLGPLRPRLLSRRLWAAGGRQGRAAHPREDNVQEIAEVMFRNNSLTA